MDINNIKIEVAYATAQQQTISQVSMPKNSTIREAILHAQLPLDIDHLTVGIFGKQRSLDFIVEDGDRVEIYRPLMIDPKAARVARVKRDRRQKQQLKSRPKSPAAIV